MADLHPPLGGVHEASLYVSDLERAEPIWRRLGLPLIGRSQGRHAFFRAGTDLLLIFNPQATAQPGGPVPPHGATGAGHVALDVPDITALDRWRAFLSQAEVRVEAEVEWPGGGRSLYFRDPDANSIELITRGTWGF